MPTVSVPADPRFQHRRVVPPSSPTMQWTLQFIASWRTYGQNQRLGQYLFNEMPRWMTDHIVGTSFDPFYDEITPEDFLVWVDNHLILGGDYPYHVLAVIEDDEILVERPSLTLDYPQPIGPKLWEVCDTCNHGGHTCPACGDDISHADSKGYTRDADIHWCLSKNGMREYGIIS